MIIITGARGTGKTFVGEAIAAKHPERYAMVEAFSEEDAKLAFARCNKADKEMILVCHGCIVSPGDLGASIPAYLIHMTKTR